MRKNFDFTDEDQNYLRQTVQQIKAIIGDESCPPVIKASLCKHCSYFDFCYITET